MLHSHPPFWFAHRTNQKTGGKGWIRTSELKRGQIYSLLALTTHPPFHKVYFVFKTKQQYYAVFLLLCQAFFYIIDYMKNVKALFIDCDGVLYDDIGGSDNIEGIYKTLDQYGISQEEFHQTRAELKKNEVRGVFNSVRELCKKYHTEFNEFAAHTVANTDYSYISPDPEMLNLLKNLATVMPIYIVTNNTRPHLNKIFDCLRGNSSSTDLSEELGIRVITIEDTLEYNSNFGHKVFHPKQMHNQFIKLCDKIKQPPACVALIDDTERIRHKAEKQGLVPIATTGPKETKQNLFTLYEIIQKERTDERAKAKRPISLRKARGRAGH